MRATMIAGVYHRLHLLSRGIGTYSLRCAAVGGCLGLGVLLSIARHTVVSADASRRGAALGVESFDTVTGAFDGDGAGNNDRHVVGTRMRVRFDHVMIKHGTQSVLIKQKVQFQDPYSDKYTGTDEIMAGFFNEGPTESYQHLFWTYHKTVFRPYVYSKTGSLLRPGKPVIVKDEFAPPTVNMTLRLFYRDACRLSRNCNLFSNWGWEFFWEATDDEWDFYMPTVQCPGCSPKGGRLRTWWYPGVSSGSSVPVNVVEAKHGLYSTDTAPGTDLHIHTENHRYYYFWHAPHPESLSCAYDSHWSCTPVGQQQPATECPTSGPACDANWACDKENIRPWSNNEEYEVSTHYGVKVFKTAPGGDGECNVRFDVCMGSVEGTPCRGVCPKCDGHGPVEPMPYPPYWGQGRYPLRWEFANLADIPSGEHAEWNSSAAWATERWNEETKLSVFEPAGANDADVLIHFIPTTEAWNERFGQIWGAESALAGAKVTPSDDLVWICPGTYFSDKGHIYVNYGNVGDWNAGCDIELVWPFMQGFEITKAPIKHVLLHELGHIIGLDDIQSNPACEGHLSGSPVMCSLHPIEPLGHVGTWSNCIDLDAEPNADDIAVAQCMRQR